MKVKWLEGDELEGYKAVRSVFSQEVEVAVSFEEGEIEKLYKEEQELVKGAVEKRQKRFAAGRACAREVLARLGIEEFPVLMDAKRAPVWPEGVSGSISHAKGCCIAVAVKVPLGEVLSVGVDVEEVNRIEEVLWDYVFGDEEVEWLKKKVAPEEAQKWASILFSAKEAFYKAQYQLTGSWLGFKDVVIRVDQEARKFEVELLVDLGSWKKGSFFKGRYRFFGDYGVCGILIC